MTGRLATGTTRPTPSHRRRRPRRSGDGERGGATLLAVALAGVLILFGAAFGVVAAMIVAHRTAQAAADLAALAGAAAVVEADPCGRAAGVAASNGAALTSCAVAGLDVTVTVVVEGPRWLGQSADFDAQARAGPVR